MPGAGTAAVTERGTERAPPEQLGLVEGGPPEQTVYVTCGGCGHCYEPAAPGVPVTGAPVGTLSYLHVPSSCPLHAASMRPPESLLKT